MTTSISLQRLAGDKSHSFFSAFSQFSQFRHSSHPLPQFTSYIFSFPQPFYHFCIRRISLHQPFNIRRFCNLHYYLHCLLFSNICTEFHTINSCMVYASDLRQFVLTPAFFYTCSFYSLPTISRIKASYYSN